MCKKLAFSFIRKPVQDLERSIVVDREGLTRPEGFPFADDGLACGMGQVAAAVTKENTPQSTDCQQTFNLVQSGK